MEQSIPIDKSNQRVRQMFAEIASGYDRMNHLLSLNIDRYWRWRTVRLVSPSGESPILDICTGTGDLAFAWCRRTRGRVPVVAADFCPEMLAVAERKRKGRAKGLERLTFLEADAQQLPFSDDSFQIVSVAFGLRNVADTARGLAEMVRVCEPGGRVAILEFSLPTRQPWKGLYGWYFRHVLPKIGQCLVRNRQSAYHYLPQSVGDFPFGEPMAERLRAAGLSQVTMYPFTLGVATLYVGTK